MKRIHHVADIDAPASTVWTALTETQGLTSWWSTRLDASSSNGSRRWSYQAGKH